MKRRDFVGAGLALAAAAPFRGWSAVLKDVGDVSAQSFDGAELTLAGSSVRDFAAGLRGDLLLRDAPDYDARRRVWNAAFDRRPAMIACCSGAADVRRAVDFARENRLLTAVRSGGHSLSGKSTCDGGLVIDLQSMRGVRVEPDTARAFLAAGSVLGELDFESAAYGLATTAGAVSHTGAAGLTLGGGYGRLGRRFGLTCDNVESFDIVTADGHFLRASDDENADLFWGLRGGGGNFGVVTAIEYRLHRMDPEVIAGNLVWPMAKARDVLRYFRDNLESWPRELYAELALAPDKDGPVVSLELCWSGKTADGGAVMTPIRAFASPVADTIKPMRYIDLQRSVDDVLSFGKRYYMKGGFFDTITDDGVDAIVDAYAHDLAGTVTFIEPSDGAYLDVPPEASAFPNRGPRFQVVIVAFLADGDAAKGQVERMRSAWKTIEPLTHGFYTNLSGDDKSLAAYRENYGANLERLVALKAKYDPMNLFRLNANVPTKI